MNDWALGLLIVIGRQALAIEQASQTLEAVRQATEKPVVRPVDAEDSGVVSSE